MVSPVFIIFSLPAPYGELTPTGRRSVKIIYRIVSSDEYAYAKPTSPFATETGGETPWAGTSTETRSEVGEQTRGKSYSRYVNYYFYELYFIIFTGATRHRFMIGVYLGGWCTRVKFYRVSIYLKTRGFYASRSRCRIVVNEFVTDAFFERPGGL